MEKSFSTPSIHVCTFASITTSIAFFSNSPLVGVIEVVVVTIIVGMSRMYFGSHYPQDILFGAVIGAGVTSLFEGTAEGSAPWVR